MSEQRGCRRGPREPLGEAVRKKPNFIERFSELQGEKGEPGAILTGDIPLERLRGRKVITSPDPEGTRPLRRPLFVPGTDCDPLSDEFVSLCFRVNPVCTEPPDRW